MRFHVRCHIFLGLFFFLQLSQGGGKTQKELALFIRKNVEHLIEKILFQMQEYYHEIKSDAKCIPDYVPDNIIETLKKSIDCVSENERNYADGKIKSRTLTKNFLTCFSEAKKEVNEIMIALDPYEDYCPENMTEKTYQINVTTIFTKTFRINIKNGLKVMHKEIDFSKDSYLDHALGAGAVYDSNGSENNEDDNSSDYGDGNDSNSNGSENDSNHEDEHDDDDGDDDDDDDNDDGDGDGDNDGDDGDDGDDDDDDDDDDDENGHNDGDEDENEHGESDDQENEPDDVSDFESEQGTNDYVKNNTTANGNSSNNEEIIRNERNPEKDSFRLDDGNSQNDRKNFDDHGDKETSPSSLDNVQPSDADKPSGYNLNSDINERKLRVSISKVQPFREKILRNNSDNFRKGKKTILPNTRNKNQASDVYRE